MYKPVTCSNLWVWGTNVRFICSKTCVAWVRSLQTSSFGKRIPEARNRMRGDRRLQDDPERKEEYFELATIWRLIAKESEDTEVV